MPKLIRQLEPTQRIAAYRRLQLLCAAALGTIEIFAAHAIVTW